MIEKVKNWFGFTRHGTEAAADFQKKVTGIKELLRNSPPLVNESVSYEQAIVNDTVFSCIDLIAGAVSQTKVVVKSPGDDLDRSINDHWLEKFLNIQPHYMWSGCELKEWIIYNMLMFGEALVYIDRNGLEVSALTPIIYGDWGFNYQTSRYHIFDRYKMKSLDVGPAGVLHFRSGIRVNDRGISLLETGLNNIVSLQMRRFNYEYDYFKNGALQRHVVTGNWDTPLTKEDRDEFERDWDEKIALGDSGISRPLLLDNVSIQPLTINPAENQMMETTIQIRKQIASVFHIQNEFINQETGAAQTGQMTSHRNTIFYRSAVSRHVIKMQQELQRKLLGTDGSSIYFDESDYLRGDPEERRRTAMGYLGNGSTPGIKTQNEVRRELDLPPIDDPLANQLYHPLGRDINKNDSSNNQQVITEENQEVTS